MKFKITGIAIVNKNRFALKACSAIRLLEFPI